MRFNSEISDMQEDQEKLKERLLLAQYNQVYNDRRYYDQAMWQIPSIVITVSSVIFAISFNFVHSALISATMLLFGAVFDLTLAIVLTKHRLTIDAKTAFIIMLEEEHCIAKLPFKSEDVIKYVNDFYQHHMQGVKPGEASQSDINREHRTLSWFRKRNAFQWTFYSILFLVAVMLALSIFMFIISLPTILTMVTGKFILEFL
jgi:hypothetical protein